MRGLRFVLEHHGLERHFATLQTADLHPSKPHPAMLQAAMAEAGIGRVGHHADRRHDLRHPDGARGRCGAGRRRAGAITRRTELHEAGAVRVLDRFEELHELLS